MLFKAVPTVNTLIIVIFLRLLGVADSVNRGISTARRMRAACIIKLSINKNLKLKKRKGKDKQQCKKLYTIT